MEWQGVLMQGKRFEHVNGKTQTLNQQFRRQSTGSKIPRTNQNVLSTMKRNIRIYSLAEFFSSYCTGCPYFFYYAPCPWRNSHPNSSPRPSEHLCSRLFGSSFVFCLFTTSTTQQPKDIKIISREDHFCTKRWQRLNTQQSNRMGFGPLSFQGVNTTFSLSSTPSVFLQL